MDNNLTCMRHGTARKVNIESTVLISTRFSSELYSTALDIKIALSKSGLAGNNYLYFRNTRNDVPHKLH